MNSYQKQYAQEVTRACAEFFAFDTFLISGEAAFNTTEQPTPSSPPSTVKSASEALALPPCDAGDVLLDQCCEAIDTSSTIEYEPLDLSIIAEMESLNDGFLPLPPPVPLHAFPEPVAVLLTELADSLGTPYHVPTAQFMALVSALVGRSRTIRVKEGWEESGNLWIVLVAKSAMKKSPCLQKIFSPLSRLEHLAKKDYNRDFAVYKQQSKSYHAKVKGGQRNVPMPQKPRWKQTIMDDFTEEALGAVLNDNPKGVLVRKDELQSLMSSRYSGAAKGLLLTSQSNGSLTSNRVSNPDRNFAIENANVGLYGGVQPDMLQKVFHAGAKGIDKASGYLPRFLFVRAEQTQPAYFNTICVSKQSLELLEKVTSTLWLWDIEYDEDDDGREQPMIAQTSPEATSLYVNWFNVLENAAFNLFADDGARLIKMQGYTLRICLLLHCLDAAIAGTDGLATISEDTMRRAIILTKWFLEQQNQCWALLNPENTFKQATPIQRAIMKVVVENADTIAANGDAIPSGELLRQVKIKSGMNDLTVKGLANAASALQLKDCKVKDVRSRRVTEEQMKIFRACVLPSKDTKNHA